MSSQRERQLWTEYAEMRQRQRTQTARKPRAKKQPQPTHQELEQALDDLVGEGEHGCARFSTLSEKALCCQSRAM